MIVVFIVKSSNLGYHLDVNAAFTWSTVRAGKIGGVSWAGPKWEDEGMDVGIGIFPDLKQ